MSDDTPPPTLAGLAALAVRYGVTLRHHGPRRPLPVAVEVAAYRCAAMLMTGGTTLTLRCLDNGLELHAPAPPRRTVRGLRTAADRAGGTLWAAGDGSVRVWLPEVFPSRSE